MEGIRFVHGLGGSRKGGTGARAKYFASLGYLTAAYDVRGQGDARYLNLSGGTTLVGEVEKEDMAEIFHFLRTRYEGILDFNRLAVSGTSQGGGHAWGAAAWSGRILPRARGGIVRFPKIRCAAPGGATADWYEVGNPFHAAFSGRAILKFFASGGGVVLDPAFRRLGRNPILAQDFAGWAALRKEPGRHDGDWLKESNVPVFAHNSWDDYWLHPNGMVEMAASMPKGTPRLIFLSTGNHGSPRNVLEAAQRQALERRWFDRFMKGVPDELPDQPSFLLAVTPGDPRVYGNTKSVWQHRSESAWPDTGKAWTASLHPRTGGRLDLQAPAGAEPPDRVTHSVPEGWGPVQWLGTANQPAKVFAAVPLSSASYKAEPLGADLEVHGRPRLEIFLSSRAKNLQVHAALLDGDPSGKGRYVTGGVYCVRGRTPGDSFHKVELGDCCHIFRKGHRLVLSVENHAWHRPPGVSELRTVPYFESYTFDVKHSKGAATRLLLPVLPLPGLSCRAGVLSLSLVPGGSVPLIVDGSGASFLDMGRAFLHPFHP